MAFHYKMTKQDVLGLTFGELTDRLEALPKLVGGDSGDDDIDSMSTDQVLQMVREGRL